MHKFKRDIYDDLLNWKNSKERSPLMIFGPRQVGKSFSIKNFGKNHYSNMHIINFWKSESYKEIFYKNGTKYLDPKEIVSKIEILFENKIDPINDLIFFDEIQDCPVAYESLKFFKEEMPSLNIICAGSYLKLFIEQRDIISKHPVGCTDEILMHPLTFAEFLQGSSEQLYKRFEHFRKENLDDIDTIIHQKLFEHFKNYLFTGGLPEVAKIFLQNIDTSKEQAFSKTRKKQQDLINQYKNDLNKYSKNTDIKKICKLFDDIPFQLNQYREKSVKRYSFKNIAKGQGYKEIKSSFDYLSSSGLIIKNFVINNPTHPLLAESKKESVSKFKAFWFDVGLLQAMLDIPPQAIINEKLGAYKGYIAENYVATELFAKLGQDLFSYKSQNGGNSAEIEFLITDAEKIIPIEVKSSHKYTKSKSLTAYCDKYGPHKAYKLTPNFPRQGEIIDSLPLYMAGAILKGQAR